MWRSRTLRRSLLSVFLLAALPCVGGAAESTYVAPVRVSAQPFRFDYSSVTGAVILIDFDLSEDGRPHNLTVRYGNSTFQRAATKAVQSWQFEPPDEEEKEAQVAVVFLFRRPQLIGPGSHVWRLPRVGYPGREAPPQPRRIIEPNHPSRVARDGLAVVAVGVDKDGAVTAVMSLYGTSEFLRAVEAAVRRWEFDPARKGTEAVAAVVVVVAYFPRPTLVQPRKARPR